MRSPTPPPALAAIDAATRAAGFDMASSLELGCLLRSLAATKPGGAMLELGTGTGLATAWLLDGMDSESTLVTVDRDEKCQAVAREHLGSDPRVSFVVADGADELTRWVSENKGFDIVFADAWAGKYHHLDEALQLLTTGGIYIVDDMLPQPNWPEGHAAKADALVDTLAARAGLRVTTLDWSTGVVIATKAKHG